METDYSYNLTVGVCNKLAKELSIHDSPSLASICKQLRSHVNFIKKVADFKGKIKGLAQFDPVA